MKRLYLAIIILSLLCCGSCAQQNERIEPVKTETKEFNLNTAMELIALKEKVFADITKKG